jgi:large subunit ribosomal protein L24
MATPKTVHKIRLKKGDKVMVRTGRDKGKTGTIVATHPTDNTVTVEGVNVAKRHLKPNKEHPQGGIIEVTKPIPVSKVGLVDPSSNKPSRIGFKLNAKGEKVRVFRPSGKEIK